MKDEILKRRISADHESRLELIRQLYPTDNTTNRESISKALVISNKTKKKTLMGAQKSQVHKTHLCHYQNIRSHSTLLDCEISSRPPKPTLNFIHNQHYPMLVAYFSQSLKKLGWGWDVTSFP